MYRRERLDRGIKARVDDIFALSSHREIIYLAGPRIFAVLALLIFPLLTNITGTYWQSVFFMTCVIALLALSWDLLYSVGLVSLGQAFFFGVGGYFTGVLNYYYDVPIAVSIPVATLGGAIICTFVIFPVLRLRGIYFALITFALPLFLMRIVEATRIFGGTEGLSGLTPIPSMQTKAYLGIVVTLIVVFVLLKLLDTDYGLVIQGIRDNDLSVLASGINIQWFKAQVVFIASLPATFAGALMTHHYQVVGMPAFAMENSILPLTSAIVGGPGLISGSVVGAFLLVPISESLRVFGTLRMVIYATALLIFVVFLSEGVFRYAQRKYFQFERVVSTGGEEIEYERSYIVRGKEFIKKFWGRKSS